MNDAPRELDVPPGVDFHDPDAATRWVAEAEVKRPWRNELFNHIAAIVAHRVARSAGCGPRVLELGSGPGLLALRVLDHCPDVTHYTLLDFSAPMLGMSRQRLQSHAERVSLAQTDFRQPNWLTQVTPPFDFVLSHQAVHELRHKRHATQLYRQLRTTLTAQGMLIVCDHLPGEKASATRNALFMTQDEQRAALEAAGFATTHFEVHRDLLLIRATPE